MAQKFGITIKRKSKLPEFNDTVKKMANSHVKIGVIEGAKDHESKNEEGETEGLLSMASLASFHEFGTETIPERSFIRSTIDEIRPELKELSKKLQAQILVGKLTSKQGLALLGEKVKSAIINKLNSGIDPDLEFSTILARMRRSGGKYSDNPLVDTGQLKQSITYKVEE